MILTGPLAPVFWAEILLRVALPFVIFAVPRLRTSRVWLVTGATLALLGVFAKRVNILLPGMYEPLVGLEPGVPGGRAGQPFVLSPTYVPTWHPTGGDGMAPDPSHDGDEVEYLVGDADVIALGSPMGQGRSGHAGGSDPPP